MMPKIGPPTLHAILLVHAGSSTGHAKTRCLRHSRDRLVTFTALIGDTQRTKLKCPWWLCMVKYRGHLRWGLHSGKEWCRNCVAWWGFVLGAAVTLTCNYFFGRINFNVTFLVLSFSSVCSMWRNGHKKWNVPLHGRLYAVTNQSLYWIRIGHEVLVSSVSRLSVAAAVTLGTATKWILRSSIIDDTSY